MSAETLDWIVAWFATHSGRPDLDPVAAAQSSYFDAGLIDSFGVLELIGDAEAQFGIVFSDRDFQDRRFSTMAGLAEIIESSKRQGA